MKKVSLLWEAGENLALTVQIKITHEIMIFVKTYFFNALNTAKCPLSYLGSKKVFSRRNLLTEGFIPYRSSLFLFLFSRPALIILLQVNLVSISILSLKAKHAKYSANVDIEIWLNYHREEDLES